MGLCGEGKKRPSGKTIVIPKGFINPDEETVIEIPTHLDGTSNLVVKAPEDTSNCLTVEPFPKGADKIYLRPPEPIVPEPLVNQAFIAPNMADPPAAPAVPAAALAVPAAAPAAPAAAPATPAADPVVPGRCPALVPSNQCPAVAAATAPAVPEPATTKPSAHSPICPICNHRHYTCPAAIPYCPAANYNCPGVSHTCPSALQHPCLGQQPKTCPSLLNTCPSLLNTCPSGSLHPCYSGFPQVCPGAFPKTDSGKSKTPYVFINYPKNEKSEPARSRPSENSLLDKLLDDKINKVLKPLLKALAKSYEEKEISPKDSFSCLNSKYLSVTRSGSNNLLSSSLDLSKKPWWKDSDSDDSGKKSYSRICTPTSGCPSRKKPSVNFKKSKTISKASLDDSSSDSDKSSISSLKREISSDNLMKK